MTISRYSLMIPIMAIAFWSSSCTHSPKVSNYCDLPSNYSGSKIYHKNPLLLAQVFDKDYNLFVERINVILRDSRLNVSLRGDHGYVVGDKERTSMMVIILDKRECIVDKIPLSPTFYKYIMGIGDRVALLGRSFVV